jgi:hypothetical protein
MGYDERDADAMTKEPTCTSGKHHHHQIMYPLTYKLASTRWADAPIDLEVPSGRRFKVSSGFWELMIVKAKVAIAPDQKALRAGAWKRIYMTVGEVLPDDSAVWEKLYLRESNSSQR